MSINSDRCSRSLVGRVRLGRGLVSRTKKPATQGSRYWNSSRGSPAVSLQCLDGNFSGRKLEFSLVRWPAIPQAIVPDYALSSHVAPLGLVFYTGTNLPAHYRGGAFVGEHGSWNRSVLNGYKIIFVPFENGRPSGQAEDVVTGFLVDSDRARGRPVGLAVDAGGGLLIADDTGNSVWRVSAALR